MFDSTPITQIINGNNRLFSALIASYDLQKIISFYEQLNIKNRKQNKEKGINVKEAVDVVFELMKTLSKFGRAVVPDAIKFEQKGLVDSSIGASYNDFIKAIETMFEKAILGQAGTTSNDSGGSFAKAKVMNLTTEDIKWTDINFAVELVNMYVSRVLPMLTSTIKAEDISFSFVFDDSQDVQIFADLMRTLATIQIRTLATRKGFALPVQEVFKGLGMQANTDYYGDDDMFVFGDNSNNFFANEMNNLIDSGLQPAVNRGKDELE